MLPSHARQEMDGNIIVLKTNRRRLILDVPRCRLDVAHQQGGAFALLRLLISSVSPAARIIGALARSPSREVTRGTPVQRVHVCVAECRAASDRS